MLSFFRVQKRQRGQRKRRNRRGKRTAQIVAVTAVATALLIPIVNVLTGGASGSGDSGSAASSTSSASNDGSSFAGGELASSDSTGTAGGGSGGESAGGESAGGDSTSGVASGSGVGAASDTASNGSGGASNSSAGTTSGSLAGYVLIFSESPPETEVSTSGSDAMPETEGTGSAFDDFPPGDITKIEEDWELTITEPDALLAAPQVGTVMTPFEDAETLYLSFALNHRVNTGFSAGGLELQLWYQGQMLGWYSVGNAVMATPNEKVQWTQRLEVRGNNLRFSVVKGKSTTWSEFGQGESLHLDIATTLPDLNDYHPNVSIENSGVSFAANRVGTLVLKSVRGYDKQGTLLVEDKDPVVVFGGGSE